MPLYRYLKKESRLCTKVSIRDVHRGIFYKTESNLSGQQQRTHFIEVRPRLRESQTVLQLLSRAGLCVTEDTGLNTMDYILTVPETELLKVLFSETIS